MNNNSITVLVPNLIGFNTLKPYISYINKKYSKKYIYIDPKHWECKHIEDWTKLDYKLLKEKSKYKRSIIYFLMYLTTPADYSVAFKNRYLEKIKNSHNILLKLLYYLSKISPKFKYGKVNFLIKNIPFLFSKNIFPSKNIVVVSRINIEQHLNSKKQNITTIIESWDHMYKAPFCYESKYMVAWCEDQRRNLHRYQLSKNYLLGYPVKLNYNETLNSDYQKRIDILYPMTYTGHSDRKFFKEEISFLKYILGIVRKHNLSILIKLKPNAKSNDRDIILKELGDVSISNEEGTNQPENYELDEHYNQNRLKIIKSTRIVINIGTTFGLDCVKNNIPVIQVNLRNNLQYTDISSNMMYEHLNLFLDNDKFCYSPEELDDNGLWSDIRNNKIPDKITAYQKHLLNWLDFPSNSEIKNRIESVIEKTRS